MNKKKEWRVYRPTTRWCGKIDWIYVDTTDDIEAYKKKNEKFKDLKFTEVQNGS